MNIDKICIVLIVFVAFMGIIGANTNNNAVYGTGTWVKYNQSNVGLSNLVATITVTIKNKGNHVEYFKISNVYQGSLASNSTIKWIVYDTNPSASKMVDAVSPELGGDWGWKIQPGQTKTVSFTVYAIGAMGVDTNGASDPTYIVNEGATDNTYWPIIPDPGLDASWFQPNEIEMLNPNLDLKSWKGTFHFKLTNFDDNRVSGIIRAPVVPTDSKLTYSSPKATFKDKDLVMDGSIAAWDVTLGAYCSKWYTYTYLWPLSSSSSSGTGKYSSASVPTTSAASKSSAASTKDTGVPYFPFVIGGILAAGGLLYARLR